MFPKHIVSTTWKNGTLLLLILYEVWSADNPESSGENTTSAHVSGQTGTLLEPSRQRDQGAVRKRILLVSVCTQSWKPVCRSTDIPDSRGKTTTCAPRTRLESSVHKNQEGVWERIPPVSSWTQSWPYDKALCTQILLGKSLSQKVLTHRLSWGTSHCKEQQD